MNEQITDVALGMLGGAIASALLYGVRQAFSARKRRARAERDAWLKRRGMYRTDRDGDE